MLSVGRSHKIVAVVAVFAVATVALVLVTTGAATRWRVLRYVARAEALAAAGAEQAARVACLRALALERDSAAAMRVLLRVLPEGDARSALMLRVRLADLDRSDGENLRALAFMAISVGRYDLAAKVAADIAKMPDGAREAREWDARILAARGDFSAAARAAQALLKEDPRNTAGRLIRALSEVFSGVKSPEAERELDELAKLETVRVEALRGLREAALRRGDRERARALAGQVMVDPRAGFSDALALADLSADGDEVEPQLAELTKRADGDVVALGLIGKWLARRGRADRVESWVAQIEALRGDEVAAELIRVEALLALKSWDRLAELLAGADWRALDFLRHAFLARAERERGEDYVASWRKCVEAVAVGGRAPRQLAETVQPWPGWEAEWEKLMWSAAGRPENTRWALSELARFFEQRQDTRSLRRVMEELLRFDSTSVPAKNNLAYYSLLLGESPQRAHRLAEEAHAEFPNDPAIVSTRALSLIVLGRPREALALLEKLPAESFSRAGVAACKALALSGDGRRDEARTAAEAIERERLLPELREKLSAALE